LEPFFRESPREIEFFRKGEAAPVTKDENPWLYSAQAVRGLVMYLDTACIVDGFHANVTFCYNQEGVTQSSTDRILFFRLSTEV
jgi:hypothetical protein